MTEPNVKSSAPLKFLVRNGHVATEDSWIYVWLHQKQIIYIGATWLHPMARAEVHFHGQTEEIRVVRAGLEKAGINLDDEFTVLAFPVPAGLDRQTLKRCLIDALAQDGHLPAVYFGPEAQATAPTGDSLAWVDQAVQKLSSHQI